MNEDPEQPLVDTSVTPERVYPPIAYAQARLLDGPIYREDEKLWALIQHGELHAQVRDYFAQIGLQLVMDVAEGVAFLRQVRAEGDAPVPRVSTQRKLGYDATVLLVCLREEWDRFDSAPGDSTVLLRTRDQLRDLAADFLRETDDGKRDRKRFDRAIAQLAQLGFLREISGPEERFELMRIVKARIGPAELEEIKQRLLAHVIPPSASA